MSASPSKLLLRTPPNNAGQQRQRRQSGRTCNTPSSRLQQNSSRSHAAAPSTPLLQQQQTLTASQGDEVASSVLARLQSLLESMPQPAPRYRVRRAIGQGTFSTVYLADAKLGVDSDVSDERNSVSEIAVKHLVPTSSPDRILMEVECLRLAGGEANVVPLLFCYRLLGDVILAMPYLKQAKFGEVIRTISYKVEKEPNLYS